MFQSILYRLPYPQKQKTVQKYLFTVVIMTEQLNWKKYVCEI